MNDYIDLVLWLRKSGRKIIQFGNPFYTDKVAQKMLDAADAIQTLMDENKSYAKSLNEAAEILRSRSEKEKGGTA